MPHNRVVLAKSRVIIHPHKVVHSSRVINGGAPALLLDNKRFEYPIKGLTKQMKMVNMSGGSVVKTQPVKRPIKILL